MRRTLEQLERLEKEFLTAGETAEYLGITRQTFLKHRQTFPFRVEKIGRKWLVPRRSFMDYIRRYQ